MAGEQQQEHITPDNLSTLIDDADAITIAIKGDANIRLFAHYALGQITHIFGNGRVGVMVGEMHVRVAVQLGYVAAKSPVKRRCNETRRSVACVDNDLQRSAQDAIAGDKIAVFVADIVTG